MLTEKGGKGGCLCKPALDGELRCPLIIRPTSEDVVTGNLFQTLKTLNPRWWLPDLLNTALGQQRFRRQIFRGLKIDLWVKQESFPSHILKWTEGRTEVDVVISWENPATTVFVEMKYGSKLSRATARNNGSVHPADQLIRNIRIGLRECGWFEDDALFQKARRDFVVLVCSPGPAEELVERYQNAEIVRKSLPESDRVSELPGSPFVGHISYQGIRGLLRTQRKWFQRSERMLIDDLSDYLDFKVEQLKRPHRNQ